MNIRGIDSNVPRYPQPILDYSLLSEIKEGSGTKKFFDLKSFISHKNSYVNWIFSESLCKLYDFF